MPMSDVARAVEVDETRGFLKAVVDAESDQILGFAALALEGGEIMAAAPDRDDGQAAVHRACGMASSPIRRWPKSFNNLFASIER